ncbi:subunit of meta cleavage enzyme [Pseudomonas kairouanensis]|uniref:Subunit of meta cleavage enzyme n=1 Tax=Pseudomonas kairouanensis TaxID=2293832 RepID=A0A4Z0AXX0_9PSED|nr:subunit of meta cleavage enzyme [Pseudomonas kairouanensis]TFY91187.1 subunit of meta cleavage enzyme [Pseudomonas kairouanensis]
MSSSNWQQNMPTPEAYRMNRVLFDVHHKPDHLKRYLQSPDLYMADINLGVEQRDAIRDNDIGAMYLAGVNPYLLRAHCLGLHIPEHEFLASLRKIKGDVNNG